MGQDHRTLFRLCGSGAAGIGRDVSSAVLVAWEGEGDAPTGMPGRGLGCIVAPSILIWGAALATELPLSRYRSPEQ